MSFLVPFDPQAHVARNLGIALRVEPDFDTLPLGDQRREWLLMLAGVCLASLNSLSECYDSGRSLH
jgi:hypothetical protein